MDADRELLLSLRLNAALARYARCLDSDHLEQWPDFFSEDCLYKVTTAENQAMGYPAALIYGSSRAMLRDRVRSLREANI